MGNLLYAPVLTPQEMLDKSQAAIRKSIRQMDTTQEELILKCKERTIQAKAMARDGQVETVRLMAKDIVRMRNQVGKLFLIKAQMESVQMSITTLKSTADMSEAMKGAAKAMFMMNSQVEMPQLREIMRTFMKESDMMEEKQSLMNETVDGALKGEEDDANEEQLVNQVLDEVSMGVLGRMGEAPMRNAAGGASSSVPEGLQNRLDALRK